MGDLSQARGGTPAAKVESSSEAPSTRFGWLGGVLCLLPPLALLALIRQYGVNVPVTDDWSVVRLLARLDHGHLTLASLWAQHFESRVFFPNLALVGLASASRADMKLDMYVSWCLLAAAGLGLAALLRREVGLSWWWLLPVSLLLFSLQQYRPALTAFILALYVVFPCLVGMAWALLWARRKPRALLLALLLAVVASYSSAQGLALWPAGLVLLVCSGQPVRRATLWVVVAAATVVVYLQGYSSASTGANLASLAAHPVRAVKFLLELLGGIVPRSSHLGVGSAEQVALGAVLLVASLALIGLALRRRARPAGLALAATLVAFAVAVALLTTSGRAQFGAGFALVPRYGMFSLWDLAGIWLGLAVLWRAGGAGAAWAKAALILAALLVAVQVPLSLHAGVVGGRELRETRQTAVQVVRDYRQASPAQVTEYVFGHVEEFRDRSAFLARERLSVFAN